MKDFLSIPYPHVITFCLVWQHHDVFQTSAIASKRLRIEPKNCILLQLFEATCVRNLLIVKYLEHEQFQEYYHVKEERLFDSVRYILKIMSLSLWPHETVLQIFCDKHPKSKSCKPLFGWCRCFRAYRLITMEWNVKWIVPYKRWENFLSDTFLCVFTLPLF